MDQALALALKYGPQLVADFIAACKKNGISISEIESIFADVKPYAAFGIPDKVPSATPAPTLTPGAPSAA